MRKGDKSVPVVVLVVLLVGGGLCWLKYDACRAEGMSVRYCWIQAVLR